MKPLRVLMVSEPGTDGVFAVVEAIIRQIHIGHPEISADLAYSSRRSGRALRKLVADIQVRGDRAIDLRVGNAPGPSDLPALWALIRFAAERGHHVVHAHSSKAGALARIARCLASFPPVIYTPHAYYGMPCLGGPKEGLFNAVESVLGQVGITTNCSEDEREFAIRRLRIPPDRLLVIHNGIETTRFAPPTPQEKSVARASLGLPPQGKILATIGRDSTQKNYTPLYNALGSLLPGAVWSFAHAGAGSEALRGGLGSEAAARCHAYEHLDDVAPLLRAADGFVMTSRYEGLSLAMLSAMSCGLPVILADAPGFRFLRGLGFDEVSWLPDPSDEESMREALRSSLAAWALSPATRLDRQRDLVCRMFSARDQLEKAIALYSDTASR